MKALAAYERATTFKEAELYPFAVYRLAWSYHAVGEYGKAQETMKSAISWMRAAQGRESPDRLLDAALTALLSFYRDSGAYDAGRMYFNGIGRPDLAAQLQ